MKPTYTISQVLAVPEGEWVNAIVFCNVSNVKPSRGKGPSSAMLTDSTGSIVGKFWGGGIEHWEGKRIKIAGAGLQRKAYNGTPELSISQKADISFAGAPGTAAQTDTHPDLEAARPQNPSQNRPAPPTHTQTTHTHGNAVNGQTVGMAVKAAVDLWIATGGSDASKGGFGAAQAAQIETMARLIIAVSKRIESGTPADEDVPF